MAYDDTSLVQEVNEIIASGPKPIDFEWTIEITLPNNAGNLTPMRVLGIDLMRDYDNNYCDEIMVEVAMGVGTYNHLIFPNKTNLVATLYRKPVGSTPDKELFGVDIDQQPFRAVIYDTSSPTMTGNDTYSGDMETGNLMGLRSVKFQLLDMAIEQTRLQSFGTVFRNVTALDAIKYAVTKIAGSLDVDAQHKIVGVDAVDPDNTKVFANITVPHGTQAVDVPRYIAYKCAMPYTAGFGAYLQTSIWYLYPLFDTTRFDKAKYSLTIVNVPKNRFPAASRTFRVTRSQVIIMATEASKHYDPSYQGQLVAGNGARYADADQTFAGFTTASDNKIKADRSKNTNEYLGEKMDSGYNNVQMGHRPVTANTFAEMSRVASRMGSVLMVQWINSVPGLIRPGMAVKYMYEVDGSIYETTGQVIKCQARISSQNRGIFPGPHSCTTVVTLFLNKDIKWYQDPDAASTTSTSTTSGS